MVETVMHPPMMIPATAITDWAPRVTRPVPRMIARDSRAPQALPRNGRPDPQRQPSFERRAVVSDAVDSIKTTKTQRSTELIQHRVATG